MAAITGIAKPESLPSSSQTIHTPATDCYRFWFEPSIVSAFSIAAPEAVLSKTHQLSDANSLVNDLISSSL
jgi:hypothetical protein